MKPLFAMFCLLAATPATLCLASPAKPPAPYGPVPTARQISRELHPVYAFVHFTVNTFTDKEWGDGDEDVNVFNPTDFDPDQIAQTARDGGISCLILTCKHHDGFCLWPSQYTTHSIKYCKWENGKGDVVRALSDACRRHGIKFGIYLSPWDRHSADYGKPAYITYYRNQLHELLTNYGPIAEVWLDGANGGNGYYGGARETRTIDNLTYYDWPNTWAMIRQLQPNAVIFSDAGPDLRWAGGENGIAGDPCWETIDNTGMAPGHADSGILNRGTRFSPDAPNVKWIPAECDVSIRPGWFWHASEDGKVKTPQELLDIYYASVGHGACLLLNLPPNRAGRIADPDVKSLHEFRQLLDATFAHNLARGAHLTASNVRGKGFEPKRLFDGKSDTYWSTDDAITSPELVVDLEKPTTFNVVRLGEYLPLGQRIDTFEFDEWKDGHWVEFVKGQGIGACRLVRCESITTTRVRVRLSGPVCPALSDFGLYAEPPK